MSLLLLFAGCGSPGGMIARRYHDPADLDKKLKEQKPFSRTQWEAALKAKEEAELKAKQLKGKQKRALVAAAKVAEEAIEAVAGQEIDFDGLTRALEAAANATKTAQIITEANIAKAAALAILAQIEEEDEEEALMLLLH